MKNPCVSLKPFIGFFCFGMLVSVWKSWSKNAAQHKLLWIWLFDSTIFPNTKVFAWNVGNFWATPRPFAELMASSGVVWRERRFHSEKLPDFSRLKNCPIFPRCADARRPLWKSLLMIHDAAIEMFDTVGGSEIPNNHLGCTKPVVNNGINYQPQLVQDFFHQQ